MSVRRLLAEVDSAELSEWLAFDRIEPLPDSYWQAGMVASVVARANGAKSCTPQDFMPARRRRPKSVEENRAAALAAFAPFLKRP
jgi:hypothetical protein